MWLYIPNTPGSMSSPSAQAEAGSISASSWQFQALAQSAWWRGKPSPSRIWFRRWNKVSWLRALCGRMPEPSTAAHGVVSWMASLAASRASRTASPAASAAASTSATCGARPGASSRRPGRGSSSSKMSPACSRRGMTTSLEPRGYGETYADWVSRLRADCSARQRSARRTNASGSSSSAWPTATVPNGGRSNAAGSLSSTGQNPAGEKRQIDLAYAVKMWPPPTSLSYGESQQPGNSRSCNRTIDLARSLPDRPISTDGEESSHIRRTLNPQFVEWLMGWPRGWTLLGWTDLGCSATALSLYRRRMRSELSRLGLPPAEAPAQLALFG